MQDIFGSIKEVIGDTGGCKKITAGEITNLGYIISDQKIVMGKKDSDRPALIIHKLVDDANRKREMDFCYLYSVSAKTGIILNKRFEHFLQYAAM